MATFVEMTVIPQNKGAIIVTVKWHANRKTTYDEHRTIVKHAAAIAWEHGQSVTVRIRAGMHNTTLLSVSNGPYVPPRKVVIQDPRGFHYTAEIKNRLTGLWKTWHHYFVLVDDVWMLKDWEPNNPQYFPESMNSNASTLTGVRTDRVEIFKENGVYYWKIV